MARGMSRDEAIAELASDGALTATSTSPVRFRPPETPTRFPRLLEYAATTGRPVNAVLAEALAEYRERREDA